VSVTVNGTTSGPFTIPTGTTPPGQIKVNLWGGNDTFTLNESSVVIGPALTVDGGAGTDSLIDNGTANADAFTVTNNTVSLTGAGTLTYSNAESLTINSQGGADTAALNFSGQSLTGSLTLNSI